MRTPVGNVTKGTSISMFRLHFYGNLKWYCLLCLTPRKGPMEYLTFYKNTVALTFPHRILIKLCELSEQGNFNSTLHRYPPMLSIFSSIDVYMLSHVERKLF